MTAVITSRHSTLLIITTSSAGAPEATTDGLNFTVCMINCIPSPTNNPILVSKTKQTLRLQIYIIIN